MIISHRCNLNGVEKNKENNPKYLNEYIEKYPKLFFEIDVWKVDNTLYFGHDEPRYKVSFKYMKNLNNVIFHVKNLECLIFLSNYTNCHYFFHKNDDYTLTSKGFIWPNIKNGSNPFLNDKKCIFLSFSKNKIKHFYHICTDYPLLYLR